MNQLIEKAQKEYKYIVIDTPPVGLVTDGLILMKHADINLYIVRETTQQMLSNINNIYKEKSQVHMSLVFNDVDSKKYASTDMDMVMDMVTDIMMKDTEKEKSFFKKIFS